jgi:hypothetical protein
MSQQRRKSLESLSVEMKSEIQNRNTYYSQEQKQEDKSHGYCYRLR